MVHRPFWKDARSRIHWSENVHFRRKRKVITTAESARSWFFGKKLTQEKKGAAGNCWQEHLQRFQMITPEGQLHVVCAEAGFVRTVSKGMYYKTGKDVGDGFGIFSCIMSRVTPFHGPIQIMKQKLGYTTTQRLALFLMSKLSVITTFMESRFRAPQHLEITPMFGWSYPEVQIAT